MRHLVLFLCLIAPFLFAEEIYKTLDEDGNTVFTDTPQKESEKVEMEEINTLPPPEYMRPQKPTTPKNRSRDYTIHITSPLDGAKIGPQQTGLNINISIQPKLAGEHFLQLYINGEAHDSPSKTNSFVIAQLRRGQKQISVSVVDNDGNVINTSDIVTVFVIRPNAKAK